MTHSNGQQPAWQLSAGVVLGAVLSACGGSDDGRAPVQAAPVAAPASDLPPARMRVMAAAEPNAAVTAAASTATITADQLFRWALKTYPHFFGTAAPQVYPLQYDGKSFEVAEFSTGNYIGVANAEVYLYGPYTSNQLQAFGPLTQFTESVCASIGCTPAPSGALNECTSPLANSRPVGYRVQLVYALTGSGLGETESSSDSVVGTSVFQGQGVPTLTTTMVNNTTIPGANITVPTTTVSTSLRRAVENNLTDTLQTTTVVTTPSYTYMGTTMPETSVSSSVRFDPPDRNIEFTLRLGESLDKSTTSISTLSGVTLPPVTSTVRITYEAREVITVRGKRHDTCRYRRAEGTLANTVTWYLVGEGIVIRSEQVIGTSSLTTELKSGTYGDSSL